MKVTVASQETAQGIPYANLSHTTASGQRGGVLQADEDGKAVIPSGWSGGKVSISHAEYATVSYDTERLPENVFLKPKVATLEPVVVRAVKPKLGPTGQLGALAAQKKPAAPKKGLLQKPGFVIGGLGLLGLAAVLMLTSKK